MIEPGASLRFDEHLKELDHAKCALVDYPDLSLTREERLKIAREESALAISDRIN
mgnify:CR=1 FL=1